MITVPDRLAVATIGREGETGRAWVEELPALADRLRRRWHCTRTGPPSHGGVAMIMPVDSPHGPAVIKISFRHPGNRGEADALRLWHGDGAVRLHADAPEDYAMLLERVDTRTLDLPVDQALVVGGELSARLAVAAPADVPRLADQCGPWEDQLRDQDRRCGHPLAGRVVDAAIETIRGLAGDGTDTMLHGDLHAGNILASSRGWLAIDPKGLTGNAAFDAMTMIIYRQGEDTAQTDLAAETLRRLAIFCTAAGLDHELARRCVQARMTSAALWELLHGDLDPAGHGPGRIAAELATALLP